MNTRLLLPIAALMALNLICGAPANAQKRATRPAVPKATNPNDAYAPEPTYSHAPEEEEPGRHHGERHTPDRIWQAHARRIAATLELAYGIGKPDVTAPNAGTVGSQNRSDFTFNLGAQYGINRNIAAYARTTYGNTTVDNNFTGFGSTNYSLKTSGLGDFELGGKVLYPVQSFLVSGDLNLGISPGNHQDARLGSDGNRYSGGFSLNPTVAGAAFLGPAGFVGAQLTYRLLLERTTNEVNGNGKLTGGNQIIPAVFYEWQHENFFISPALWYVVTDDTKINVGGVSSTLVTDSVLTGAARVGFYPLPNLRVAGQWALSKIPDYNNGTNTVVSFYRNEFLVSGRMEF